MKESNLGKKLINLEQLKNKIADMATNIDAARLLVWKAAFLKDQGKPFEKREFNG